MFDNKAEHNANEQQGVPQDAQTRALAVMATAPAFVSLSLSLSLSLSPSIHPSRKRDCASHLHIVLKTRQGFISRGPHEVIPRSVALTMRATRPERAASRPLVALLPWARAQSPGCKSTLCSPRSLCCAEVHTRVTRALTAPPVTPRRAVAMASSHVRSL